MAFSLVAFLASCRAIPIPEGAIPVKNFDKSRYLGTWYEVARLDHRFERELNNVTANYSLNDDGTIKVENRGFNYVRGEWKQAIGKAKFVGDTTEARLKVSFFGPFYGGYNVVALDPEYQYALVVGNNLGYLWILSRSTTIPDSVRNDFLNQAQEIGFDTSKLIWVEHDQ
jgi:apolipoprotein D and lipocalin family protein